MVETQQEDDFSSVGIPRTASEYEAPSTLRAVQQKSIISKQDSDIHGEVRLVTSTSAYEIPASTLSRDLSTAIMDDKKDLSTIAEAETQLTLNLPVSTCAPLTILHKDNKKLILHYIATHY